MLCGIAVSVRPPFTSLMFVGVTAHGPCKHYYIVVVASIVCLCVCVVLAASVRAQHAHATVHGLVSTCKCYQVSCMLHLTGWLHISCTGTPAYTSSRHHITKRIIWATCLRAHHATSRNRTRNRGKNAHMQAASAPVYADNRDHITETKHNTNNRGHATTESQLHIYVACAPACTNNGKYTTQQPYFQSVCSWC